VLDAGELTAVPGTAATPSQNFDRWAVGLDLGITLETKLLGKSRLYGEVFIAQNADRGVFVADPIATGTNVRELGFYAAFLQDVTRWGIIGFRIDRYDPNSDFLDKRVGKLVPADASLTTLSPLIGLTLPDLVQRPSEASPRASRPFLHGEMRSVVRLVFQYDAILDKLARNSSGVPTDLRNDQLTLRLQGEL